MKKRLLSVLKILLIMLIYLLVSLSAYILYLNKSEARSYIIELIIMGLFYLLFGLLVANSLHKKGLLVGLFFCIILFFIIKFSIVLVGYELNIDILEFLICITCGALGGFLGINFKKII